MILERYAKWFLGTSGQADPPPPVSVDLIRTDYPDIARIFFNEGFEVGMAKGSETGMAMERDRAGAILVIAQHCADWEFAQECISEGTQAAEAVRLTYEAKMAAGDNDPFHRKMVPPDPWMDEFLN